MEDGYILSDDDLELLRNFKRFYNRVIESRPSFLTEPVETDADVYIASVDTEEEEPAELPGIEDITPGTSKCKIYKLDPTDDPVELVPIENPNGDSWLHDVYNVGAPISSKYFLVVKTKFGAWVASSAGGALAKIGRPTAEVPVDGIGSFVIYERPTSALTAVPNSTSETIEAYHDWMTGGIVIPAGTDCVLLYFATRAIWRVVNVLYECEEP